jgi:hypothetical protein
MKTLKTFLLSFILISMVGCINRPAVGEERIYAPEAGETLNPFDSTYEHIVVTSVMDDYVAFEMDGEVSSEELGTFWDNSYDLEGEQTDYFTIWSKIGLIFVAIIMLCCLASL